MSGIVRVDGKGEGAEVKYLNLVAFLVFAIAGIIQTVQAMRAIDDIDKLKWQLHSVKSLGFMILFYLMAKI